MLSLLDLHLLRLDCLLPLLDEEVLVVLAIKLVLLDDLSVEFEDFLLVFGVSLLSDELNSHAFNPLFFGLQLTISFLDFEIGNMFRLVTLNGLIVLLFIFLIS